MNARNSFIVTWVYISIVLCELYSKQDINMLNGYDFRLKNEYTLV